MNRFENITKPLRWFMALLLAAVVAGCGGGNGVPGAGSGPAQTGSTCSGASCVNLGTAANYVVFANTGIHTDAGASVIIGNIATGPGVTSTAITGFALNLPAASPFSTTPQVSGKVYAYDYAPPTPTEVNTASNAMGTAYTAAAGKTAVPGTCPGAGSFDGGVVPPLAPGVYTCSGASGNVTIPNDFTLNGTSTDVWVFQIAGTLDETSAKHVLLTGGALPQNVFWQVAGAATIGSTAHFEGILLDQTAITFGHLSSVKGRLMAQTAVTLDATTVTQP